MDILNPELYWLDGICYRVNNTTGTSNIRPAQREYIEEGSKKLLFSQNFFNES
jgi:hypothetical protein